MLTIYISDIKCLYSSPQVSVTQTMKTATELGQPRIINWWLPSHCLYWLFESIDETESRLVSFIWLVAIGH